MKLPALLLSLPLTLPLCLWASLVPVSAITSLSSLQSGYTPIPPVQDPLTGHVRFNEGMTTNDLLLDYEKFYVTPGFGHPYTIATGLTAPVSFEELQFMANTFAESLGDSKAQVDIMASLPSNPDKKESKRIITRRITLHTLSTNADIDEIIGGLGATKVSRLAYARRAYVIEFPDSLAALRVIRRLETRNDILLLEPSLKREYFPHSLEPEGNTFVPWPTLKADTGRPFFQPGDRYLGVTPDNTIPPFLPIGQPHDRIFVAPVRNNSPSIQLVNSVHYIYQWYLANKTGQGLRPGQFTQVGGYSTGPLLPIYGDFVMPIRRPAAGVLGIAPDYRPSPPPAMPPTIPPIWTYVQDGHLLLDVGEDRIPANDEIILKRPLTDLRLDLARSWEMKKYNNGLPLVPEQGRGFGIKVMLIDDGFIEDQDLSDAFDDFVAFGPKVPLTGMFPKGGVATHGIAMSGIIGARESPTEDASIVGIAAESRLVPALLTSTFIEPWRLGDALLYNQQPTVGENGEDIPISREDEPIDGLLCNDAVIEANRLFDVCNLGFLPAGPEGTADVYNSGQLVYESLAAGSLSQRASGENDAGPNGVVYVAPSGNASQGSSNYVDLLANPFVIVVAPTTDMGRQTAYASRGANIMVAAPSGGTELPPVMDWRANLPSLTEWPRVSPFPPALPIAYPLPIQTQGADMRPSRFPNSLPVPGSDTLNNNWARRFGHSLLTTGKTFTFNSAAGEFVPVVGDFHDHTVIGSSPAAAMVSGVAATILHKHPRFGYRDVMEILMRSARMINDVRYGPEIGEDGSVLTTTSALPVWRMATERNSVQHPYNPIAPVEPSPWDMGPLGKPFHYAFGTGLVDAELALRIADKWVPLPFIENKTSSTFNPPGEGVDNKCIDGARPLSELGTAELLNTRQGGLVMDELLEVYNDLTGGEVVDITPAATPITMIQSVLGFSATNSGEVAFEVDAPPAGFKVEHVKVFVELYHGRRGDIEITLKQPPTEQFPKGMNSILYSPHRQDQSRNLPAPGGLGGIPVPSDGNRPFRWNFVTLRHWGTIGTGTDGSPWRLVFSDKAFLPRNPAAPPAQGTTPGNPTFVSADNPVAATVTPTTTDLNFRVTRAQVVYIGYIAGTVNAEGDLPPLPNSPPVIASQDMAQQGIQSIKKNTIRVNRSDKMLRWNLPVNLHPGGAQNSGQFPVTEWNFFDNLDRDYDTTAFHGFVDADLDEFQWPKPFTPTDTLSKKYLPTDKRHFMTAAEAARVHPFLHEIPIGPMVREYTQWGLGIAPVFNTTGPGTAPLPAPATNITVNNGIVPFVFRPYFAGINADLKNPANATSMSTINHKGLNEWRAYDTSKRYLLGIAVPPQMDIRLVTRYMQDKIPAAALEIDPVNFIYGKTALPVDPTAPVPDPTYPFYPENSTVTTATGEFLAYGEASPPHPDRLRTALKFVKSNSSTFIPDTGAIEFTPSTLGQYRFTVIASSDVGFSAPKEYTIEVVEAKSAATLLAEWASSYGLVGTAAEFNADPDGDGYANILEYAVGTNPSIANTVFEPLKIDTINSTLQITRADIDPRVELTVEGSSNLRDWQKLTLSQIGETIIRLPNPARPLLDGFVSRDRVITSMLPQDFPTRFFRLRATLSTPAP